MCTSRRSVQNEALIAKIDFDAGEKGLPKGRKGPSERPKDGDRFILSQDSAGQNDGRNIDELISLQSGDPRDPTKLGFQDIFGVMIAGVGSSVNSSKIAADIQEENMMTYLQIPI